MYIAPDLEECSLVEPLCRLLEDLPELSGEHRGAGTWAKLLRESLGNAGDDTKPLGYGAVARCFRVHREILEKQLRIEKIKNPDNAAHLYRLSLLSLASATD